MIEYTSVIKNTNLLNTHLRWNTENEIKDLFWWDDNEYYIIKLGDVVIDFPIVEIDKMPLVTVTPDNGQDTNNLVTDFTWVSNLDNYNKKVDSETFKLIKDWCDTQAEGCEEAFISLGIEDKTDLRYIAYRNEVVNIKTSQNSKKIS